MNGNRKKQRAAIVNNPDSDSIEILKKLPQKNKPPLPQTRSPISSMVFKDANQDVFQLKVETMTGFRENDG